MSTIAIKFRNVVTVTDLKRRGEQGLDMERRPTFFEIAGWKQKMEARAWSLGFRVVGYQDPAEGNRPVIFQAVADNVCSPQELAKNLDELRFVITNSRGTDKKNIIGLPALLPPAGC